jgi:NAD(P)-dependent dehydrogenase (short-subunit alcohol dehydrogenase family)
MSETKPIVVITGANRGIGRAIAEGLLARGCFVVATIRSDKNEPPASLTINGFDLDKPESIRKGVTAIEKVCGKVDVLINNAAILLDWTGNVTKTDDSIFLKTFQTNVLGTNRVTNAMVPLLRKSGAGRIINMSSRAGQLASMRHWAPAYSISKTALNALTRQQAGAFAEDNIAVNCMSPGWVRTDMGGAEAERSPEEGADTAIWLALEADQSLTGKFFADRAEIAW